MAAKRDRSVGRRISTFFGTSQPTPPSPSRTHPTPTSDRPASRGRTLTTRPHKSSENLLTPDGAFQPPTSDHLSPNDLMPPPPVPFAADSPRSRTSSPVMRSRPSTSSGLRPNSQTSSPVASSAHPPGFHNPAHASTAPETDEVPPPILGPPRTKTSSLETEKKLKRRSWMPGTKEKSSPTSKLASAPNALQAWITGHADKVAYNLDPLIQGQRLEELWEDTADTFIHLFPQASQKGPSMRLPSSILSSSPMLTQLAHGNLYSPRNRPSAEERSIRQISGSSTMTQVLANPALSSLSESENSSSSSSRGTRSSMNDLDDSPRNTHLYVPILSSGGALSAANKTEADVTSEDVEALIAVRNMFAFLKGQSLIATPRRPGLFPLFLKIAESLTAYGFTNLDGSTYGEVAASSFDQYVDEFGFADVRASREKTIEGILLGERMRSVFLYNDAFTHAVGKYSDIQEVCQLPGAAEKFQMISQTTRNRMERASIDLGHREKSIKLRLSNFDFPSVFAGILGSKMASERKQLRFNAWREAFNATRRHIIGYYKQKFGGWLPKASSKKNNLETGGLNRLVVKELYRDFSDIYDLYVDRTSLTVRVNNDLLIEHLEEDDNEPATKVLRRVFDEYDRAHVPIQPPIPFDAPLIPSLATVSGKLSFRFTGNAKTDARLKQKKMKQEEATRVLDSASNPDTVARCRQNDFLAAFRTFEHLQAKNSTIAQMADFRCGMWIFIYAVMQALPLLAVDAPNVRYGHGVEYFLCEPPRSGVPWANPDALRAHGRVSRTWFGVANGGMVSLPSDLVEHGVEGIYRRSHCWTRAREWSANLGIQQGEVTDGQMSDEPQAVAGSESGSATLRAPAASGPRKSADHARSMSQPFAVPPLPFANPGASRSAHDLSEPAATGHLSPPALTIPYGMAPQSGSRPTTPGTATPRSGSADRRKSVLQFGLEALPMPQGVTPQGMPRMSSQPGSVMHSTHSSIGNAAGPQRSRPVTQEGTATGKTFDDIIKGMEAEKPTNKKGKKTK